MNDSSLSQGLPESHDPAWSPTLAPGHTPELSPASSETPFARRLVCGVHGAFFLAAGLWPLLHLSSFERVTGPKHEDWLMKGMGTVLSVVGATLLRSAIRARVTPEVALLANGTGLGLATLDTYYTARGRIRRIYRLDAVIQAAFALAWVASRGSSKPKQASVPSLPPVGSQDID